MTKRRIAPVLVLALSLIASLGFLAVAAPFAAAQTPPPTGETLRVHPEAKKAIDRIKSPYCPGEMLEVCPSSGGAMLRDSIQRMAERGLTADSIVEIVVREYGEQYRAQPKVSGMGLWAWVFPPVVLLGGLGIVGVVLAHRRRGLQEAAATVEPVAPEDEAKLRAAMKELDEAEEPVF
ncbi:MAG: cytochrome c-type biogenesis protein CcmH [Gemmatimonadetes bacterium]|nr:cytochrome c-type biogenesis protein CcmH [Gemmatimonadota bacterium]